MNDDLTIMTVREWRRFPQRHRMWENNEPPAVGDFHVLVLFKPRGEEHVFTKENATWEEALNLWEHVLAFRPWKATLGYSL